MGSRPSIRCAIALGLYRISLQPALTFASEAISATTVQMADRLVFCGGGKVKRRIEYSIVKNPNDDWNALVTINGQTMRAMTAYSFFGRAPPPKGFVVALLGEDRSEFLVFRDGNKDWLEFGDYTYRPCD